MQNVTVKDRQNILDIAVLTDGDVEACVEQCMQLGTGITDDLLSGQILTLEDTSYYDEQIVDDLRVRRAKPATALAPDEVPPDGIGYMQIGNDFIVR